MTLNSRILTGALLGLAAGLGLQHLGTEAAMTPGILSALDLVSGLFIDALKMLLIPLVFTSIVVGVAQLRAHAQMHKVWVSALIFFSSTTAIAIVLGLLSMHLFRPGEHLQLEMFREAMGNFTVTSMAPEEFLGKQLRSLFVNPFVAMTQGNILAVVIFGLMLGIAIVTGGNRYQNILHVMEEFLDLLLRMVGWIMHIAPFGIFALLAKLVATQDIAILASLAGFAGTVIGTTAFHGLVVLPLILFLVTGKSPRVFFRQARPALLTAFATSSSAATLPVTLRCLEEDMQVAPDIAGFVAPLGTQINMDGTAMYEAAAALFIANLCGVELGLGQQLVVCLTAMLASIGAPGIPSAGLVTMVMVLQAVGLPAEAIAILLPLDRVLDTFRTTVNVEGDMIGSLVVQKMAGHTSPVLLPDPAASTE
jgi:Na+/H+-dicarboxylate symporter